MANDMKEIKDMFNCMTLELANLTIRQNHIEEQHEKAIVGLQEKSIRIFISMKLPVWYFTMSAVPNTNRRTIPSVTRTWMYKEDQFFSYDDTPVSQKVRVATLHFDDTAIEWHRSYLKSKFHLNYPTWDEYVYALMDRFGGDEDSIFELIYQLARNTESQLQAQMRLTKNIMSNGGGSFQKFVPGHKYATSNRLHLLEVNEEHAMIVEDQPQETEPSIQQEGEKVVCKISFQALQGLPDYQTLRVTGYCDQGPLKILIDPGSTHNFMEEELIKKWGLGVQTVNPQLINVVDGGIRKTVEACKVFNCLMGGASFEDNFLLIPLGSSDIILGDQWLKPLEAKNLGKMADNGAQQFMIKVMPKTNETIDSEEEIPEILALNKEYDIVFVQPKGLPPTRGSFDHRILLENNSNPVNLRPYRYSSK
ncbi:hypothetical protein KY285_025461 [Solanum tuberosum]|nr:hypothetical protein KY289_023916 [Solanum tuberosum]KAH0677660.1 hypothetical protein KY285_025461 [Solanum tuberosum]